jgi:DNA polymerase-3 subunit delta
MGRAAPDTRLPLVLPAFPMDSLVFLEQPPSATPQPIYVLHGEEDFLKRQVLAALRERILGDGTDSMGYSTHPGDSATYAAVHDELETLPFLSRRRLVVIDSADSFVTRHRAALEGYIAKPAATGTLVLEMKSWPSNTRLYRVVPSNAVIVCKTPKDPMLGDWCVRWASSRHGKALTVATARMLVDLVGPHMGMLDQELAKLTNYVGDAKRIDEEDVDKLVGHSRQQDTWKIFDAIGAGRSGEALAILARLFDQGEDPMKILGAFSWHLRKLAQAARLAMQGRPMGAALAQAGIPPFAVQGCEQQLKHLTRQRASQLFDWLLETDLGLKGGSQLPERLVLERLVVRLARKA